jgi:hypothetical protein
MRTEILNPDQIGLLPILKLFRKDFYLVGGTAIALQFGHRRSIDFDLFTLKPFGSRRVLNVLAKAGKSVTVTRRVSEQLNLVVDNVKITFFEYPYAVDAVVNDATFRMPDLLSLAAMKAFALGRRSKWKDYVDLFFLFRDRFSLSEVIRKAEEIFGAEFSAKLFRGQLAYHADIDYSEEVDFLPGFAVGTEDVRTFLIDRALEGDRKSVV